MTYVDRNQQTGNSGEDRVSLAFQDIGWAKAVKVPHDIGDDLITFARTPVPRPGASNATQESDLADLEAPVFVQVKSSRTKYTRTRSEHNGRRGWWFNETAKDHFDHWLRFDLPYLLVLHDERSTKSYWAHVHAENLVSTPNSRKIFVPEEQEIDERSLPALNRVAVSERAAAAARIAGEATRPLTPSQVWRHALMVPHRVAPLLVSGTKQPEQALALLLLGRGAEVDLAMDEGAVPKRATWRKHESWGWRFLDALTEVLETSGEPRALERLQRTARFRYQIDACRVVRGCVAFIDQRTKAAQTRFTPDRYSSPVDRAWLHAHRSHAFLETNKTTEAASAAHEALACLQAQSGDVTVSAIRAAATAALYTATASQSRGVDATAVAAAWNVARAAQENLTALWRAEVVSSALDEDLGDRFRAWSGTTIRHVGRRNPGFTELNGAAWTAAFGGAWGNWRSLARLAAQISLITTTDASEISAALTTLTRSGHTEHMKSASGRLWLNGPVDALIENLATLEAEPWSLRVEGPVLAALGECGDLLSSAAADNAIARILDLVKHGPAVRRVGGSSSDRWHEIDRPLGRLLFAASSKGHARCAQLVIDEIGTDTSRTDAVVRIARRLRVNALSKTMRGNLVHAARARSDHYRSALLETLAPDAPEALEQLKELARAGDGDAVRSLLVLNQSDDEDWTQFGRQSAKAVTEMVAAASDPSRAFGFGGPDRVHDLALAAFHTGNARHWKLVTDTLRLGVLPGEQVSRCVFFLAARFAELPSAVQGRLRRMAPTLTAHTDDFFDARGDFDAAVFALQVVSGALQEGDALAGMLETRHASSLAFVRLLGNLEIPERYAFLVASTVDPDPEVRAQAGFGIVRLASQEPARAPALAKALRKALELNQGCRMPVGVGTGLRQYTVDGFGEVRRQLAKHPSAVVRIYVQ